MSWLETSTENCTVQRTLGLIGEKWSLLVLRDAMNGVRRFDDFRRHMGVSEAILADRLRTLVAAGIFEATPYREPGARTRNEYVLTEKGWGLWPVLIALKQWGDRNLADPSGAPWEVHHRDCGGEVGVAVYCEAGHGPLSPSQTAGLPGPTAHAVAGLPLGAS
jgi:DNA-binding HxlR family transcriptional regulator